MKYHNKKDELFYSDLVYEIKRLDGLDITYDETTIKIIEERKQAKPISTKSDKTVLLKLLFNISYWICFISR